MLIYYIFTKVAMVDFIYEKNNSLCVSYINSVSDIKKSRYHIHDMYELYIHMSGDMNFFADGKIYGLLPNDILIFRDSEIHRPVYKRTKTYVFSRILFDPDIIRDLPVKDPILLQMFENRDIGSNIRLRPSKKESLLVDSIIEEISTLHNKYPNHTTPLALAYFIKILSILNNIFDRQKYLMKTNHNNPYLNEFIKHIDENLTNDLRLQIISNLFFVSPQNIIRLFKINTGGTYHEYVTYKRIVSAKGFLTRGYTIKETCIKSGFNDYSNFIRAFKSIVGISPGKYRSKNRS